VTRNFLGVPLHGKVELVVYEFSTFPSPVPRGGEFTASLTVLNRGTVSAMYMNVSFIPEPPFEVTENSAAYLGEVATNAPAPLSIDVAVDPGAEEGVYPMKVIVEYRDEYNKPHESTFNVQVHLGSALPSTEVTQTPGTTPATQFVWIIPMIVAVVAVVAAVSIFVVRQRRKV